MLITAKPIELIKGLLKNAHLLRWTKNLVGQRTSKYAFLLNFLSAWHLGIFEQPLPRSIFQQIHKRRLKNLLEL